MTSINEDDDAENEKIELINLSMENININYNDDQWSPNNIFGKKYYHHNQLFALRNVEASKILPKCKQKRLGCLPTKAIDLMPDFVKKLQLPSVCNIPQAQFKYNYNVRKSNVHNNKATNESNEKSNTKRINLKLNDSIKLNESPNAWKPSSIRKSPSTKCEDNEQLNKIVRSILNKLTADNFDILLAQIESQNIDTISKLDGVIDLIFHKAIDEPNFSAAYAQLCKQLITNCFAINCENNSVTFKRKLIKKCQQEFEQNFSDGTEIKSKIMEIQQKLNECKQSELKTDYRTIDLIDEEQKLRRRSVCTIRFIGELYRVDLLVPRIMMICIRTLLDNKSEENIECLCKLLTTIGEKLETKQAADLAKCFETLQQIVNQKNCEISLRIKFMLQDLIELRQRHWKSK